MFHFFGVESDSMRVREAINKMVEKGRIGNFSLVSTHYALHQEPGLVLQVGAIYFLHFIHFVNVMTLPRKIYYNVMQTTSLLKFMNLHGKALTKLSVMKNSEIGFLFAEPLSWVQDMWESLSGFINYFSRIATKSKKLNCISRNENLIPCLFCFFSIHTVTGSQTKISTAWEGWPSFNLFSSGLIENHI